MIVSTKLFAALQADTTTMTVIRYVSSFKSTKVTKLNLYKSVGGKVPFTTFSPIALNTKIKTNNSIRYQKIFFSSIPGFKINCWKCGTEVQKESEFALLVCSKCDSPQSLTGTNIPNYYELLGHKQTYQVDLNNLALKVKQLQRKLHPDLYAQKGKKEQELSQELSSLVNKAFGTLSDPIERGRYLLKLHGVDDHDAEKQKTNDPDFLEEVMELNERLETLSSEKEWMDFRQHNETTFKQLQKKLENAMERLEIKEAQIILGRMTYYDTLQWKLKDLKSKLGIVE